MARFLVVDDDHHSVSGMAGLLTDDGHEVAPFSTGAAAIAALARESFDAVVTDLEMPHVDGHAVVAATREHHPDACLVVMTTRRDDSERLADSGVCIVADKPLDYEHLAKSVAECRARGGPGQHGRCHMRSRKGGHEIVKIRRK